MEQEEHLWYEWEREAVEVYIGWTAALLVLEKGRRKYCNCQKMGEGTYWLAMDDSQCW